MHFRQKILNRFLETRVKISKKTMKIKEPLNPLVRSVVKSNEKSQKPRPAPQGYLAPVAKVNVIQPVKACQAF